jgi:hypothetical protein
MRIGLSTKVNSQPIVLTSFAGVLDESHNAGYTTDVAYSLRKLRAEYEGSAIRIRRSQDDAEIDIGFNDDGSLNTDLIASHCADKNGFVTKWYDQSGNSRDAVQATSTKQPAIYEAGAHVKDSNSRSFVKFDDTDDVLDIGDEVATDEAFKHFIVIDPTSSGRIYDSNGQHDNILVQGYRYIFRISNSNVIITENTGLNYNILDVGRNNDGLRNFFVNGTDKLSGAGSVTGGSSGFEQLGSDQSAYGGAIYEFFRFSGDTKIANIDAAVIRTAMNEHYEVF